MPKKLPQKLPRFLYRYFWDVAPQKINLPLRAQYVAERIMDRGDISALKWLIDHYSKNELKKIYLESRNIAQFSRPFWAAYLKIYPIKKICTQPEFLQSHGAVWPY